MCVASLKSMTIALKAKKALEESYIDCEIIKLEPNMTKKGCAYGIKFNCVNINSLENVLKKKRVMIPENELDFKPLEERLEGWIEEALNKKRD